MKKYKKITLFLFCILVVLTLCSCSKKEMESVQYNTVLNISDNFSGTRTITVIYPDSVFSPDSDTANGLETAVRKNCPSSLTYSKTVADNKTKYTFVLEFSSISDYKAKLSELLENEPSVVFSDSDSALTKGWRIEEDFQSLQLLKWIKKSAKNDNVELPDYKEEERNTSVTYKKETSKCDAVVSVNKRSGSPIEKISINTVNKTNAHESLYDRTITFVMTQKTFDSLGDKVKEYFSSVTDENAYTEWALENKKYIFKVEYEDINIKQLEGYTNRLFSSVYGDIEYVDKTLGSTPLAYQNSYTETLDFSGYVGPDNKDVPIEYTYSLSGSSKLDQCRIYNGQKWTAADDLMDTNNPGKVAAIYYDQPSLTLRINDGKQYVPESIDVTVTPLDNDNIRKSLSFVYDISKNGYEATDYTASYFEQKGMTSQKTVDGGNSICTINAEGSADEVNIKLTDIFGDDNIVNTSSSVPFMTLRTRKETKDTVDLSSILVGDNLDTPINYTLKPSDGERAESLTLQYNDSDDIVSCEADKNGIYSFRLSGTGAKLTSIVTAPNVADIIIFCVIGIIMIITSSGFIIYFRNKSKIQQQIEGGDDKPKLEKRKSTLAKIKKENSKGDEK